MKTKLAIHGLLTIVLAITAQAQGTAFTYQGRLNDGPNPAGGIYDLRFAIYGVNTGGSVIAGPVTNVATDVSNGLFTITLDFGANVFTGADRWLEIGVRTNGGGAFTTLNPRQPITPTPYALYAKSVNAAGIAGALPSASLSGTYNNPLTFLNGANSFSGSFYGQFFGTSFTGGSFSGDGSGLLNLNASQITGGTFPSSSLGNAWRIIGNSGTSETNFIGTTENHALDFRVANSRGFRIEPDPRIASDSANIIGGNPANRIERPDSGGSAIAGGGFAGGPNIIRSNSSGVFIGAGSANEVGPNANDVVLAGGFGNIVKTYGATIGGGRFNLIQTNSDYSVIAGGAQNVLHAEAATIGGGVGNTNLGYAGTIAGGFFNTASNNGAFVGGGGINVAGGFNSVVAGGNNNVGTGEDSVIGGGRKNTNRSFAATIGGGYWNQITNSYATVPGGALNLAGGIQSFAAGTMAKAIHAGTFVWNDSTGTDFLSITNNEFAVRASGGVRFVTPGAGISLNGQPVLTADSTNALTLNNPANTINGTFNGNGGGLTNLNAWRLDGNTVLPGQFLGSANNQNLELRVNNQRRLLLDTNANVVLGNSVNIVGPAGVSLSSILSGSNNQIRSNSSSSVIASGGSNTITNGTYATISGGLANYATGFGATVGGGVDNGSFADRATVVGGSGNKAVGDGAFVGGGFENTALNGSAAIVGGLRNTNSAPYGFIGGGQSNRMNSAFANDVIVGGLNNNVAGGNSFVGGGENNTIQNANHAMIPGGLQNTVAADYGFAAGRRAKANHQGAFVWADATDADLASTANNQFLVRAAGGVGINTNNPTAALHVGGIPGTDGIRFPNGTLQTTAPVPVFASGPGLNPTSTNQFLAQTVTVTVNSSAQKILVTSHKALGSTAATGANNLSLYIGFRPAGNTASPSTVGGGTLGNRVTQNTRITMGLSAMITGLAPGDYEVGLMGVSSEAANWNSNEFSYTTATVY